MVFVSMWGSRCQLPIFYGGSARRPHCRAGSCFPTQWQSYGKWLRPKPFLTTKKVSCFQLQLPPICCPESGAGLMGKPSSADPGLHMPPSQSTEGQDPQKVDGPLFRGTDGAVENGNTSGIGVEVLLGGGKSSGRSIGGIPLWAAERTEESLPPKLLTLVIIHKEGKVLLGMKKRGFGKGYYNGFGGKVENGETIDDAAAREVPLQNTPPLCICLLALAHSALKSVFESVCVVAAGCHCPDRSSPNVNQMPCSVFPVLNQLKEESGVTPLDMSKRGILTFHFDNDPQPWEVHVYHVSEIVGEPYETEEMVPRWFTVSEIPYEAMWEDDILWYPELLKGRHFEGSFYFENTTTLVAHSLRLNSNLDMVIN